MNDVQYQECRICVLDTNDDPNITFDESGVCNYYHEYKAAEKKYVKKDAAGQKEFLELIEQIKRDGYGKQYDCLIGLSGGVDSSYVALLVKKHGLRPLAVHIDNGWNTEEAVRNIENIVGKLNIDLWTHILDWHQFKDLQRAYLKASVIDIETITDHAQWAYLLKLAIKENIKHIIGGFNIETEFVLPNNWVFNKYDHVNIKSIHKKFGTIPIDKIPLMSTMSKKWGFTIKGITRDSILDYFDCNVNNVKNILRKELGWVDYGGKHTESIFTRFYQGYILPKKFGVDKRKAHYSNMIFSQQITKSEAVALLKEPHYDVQKMNDDLQFILKKLNFSKEEFELIMRTKPVPHENYGYEQSLFLRYPYLVPFKRILRKTQKLASNL